jgi:hypothetical protein
MISPIMEQTHGVPCTPSIPGVQIWDALLRGLRQVVAIQGLECQGIIPMRYSPCLTVEYYARNQSPKSSTVADHVQLAFDRLPTFPDSDVLSPQRISASLFAGRPTKLIDGVDHTVLYSTSVIIFHQPVRTGLSYEDGTVQYSTA